MKYLGRIKNQSGDTIVEVILALTVLSLVVGTASVLANRNTRSLQDNQEHAVALRYAQAQLEYLKRYAAKNPTTIGDVMDFCLHQQKDAAGNETTSRIPSPATRSECTITPDAGGAEYKMDTKLSFVPDTDNSVLNAQVTVRWQSIANTSEDAKVQLSYRIYKQLNAGDINNDDESCPAGYMENPVEGALPRCVQIPPTVRVEVKKIAPYSNNTSNSGLCTSGNLKTGMSGRNVTLQRVGGASQSGSTGSDGVVRFTNDIFQHANYRVTNVSVPGNYFLCSTTPTPSTAVTAQAGAVQTITYLMYPYCWTETRRGADELRWTAPYIYDYQPNYSYYWDRGARVGQYDGYRGAPHWTWFVENGIYYEFYQWSNIYPGLAWYNAWLWQQYSYISSYTPLYRQDPYWVPTYYNVNVCQP